jgi:hypothetical protein
VEAGPFSKVYNRENLSCGVSDEVENTYKDESEYLSSNEHCKAATYFPPTLCEKDLC